MSLIQDALKRKTEEQNPLPAAPPPVQPEASKEPAPPPVQPTAPKEPAPPPAQPAAPKKPAPPPAPKPTLENVEDNSSTRKLFIILSVSIVLILLIIGSGIYLVMNRPATDAPTEEEVEVTEELPAVQAPLTPPVVPAPAQKPAPEPAPEPTPKKVKKDNWPELTFSGSAVGGNEILAIINGRMLSVGNQLRGVKVLQIGKNEVMVEFEGEKRILRVDDE